MLDKSKINNLRDLLVGVVPNPVDQVKQITIALVYKFMNDMDDFNQNFAGKRIYFVKDYAQFAWSKLMDDKLTNLERLNLYADALQQIELNKDIPDVFQHIFKGAFLSYRNPETLTLFLKEISGFNYNNDSEQLGDAFEYLLSVLGSQKDAGQFRTPRHIIDFMVRIIKPSKTDTILDPACGTAGFLISAFQYIRDTANLQLSEFSQVFNNIYGYDITPDMVKIALINLYLHRDTNPHIYEYDTLSNDEKWGEKFNIILANPPFMTPKGGIKPHSKFRLKATKSEVLFCDYILEHLRLNGRAGIVVPEGIIFQSANVYKQLREMLVMGENNQGNLIAVISLPSGVFKPYSGVKTSILIVDKQAAKATDNILLVKINNDGYDLGDKRNPITANDLPHALELIEYYQLHNQLPEDNPFSQNNAQLISKQQLKENDFNLSFDRYKTSCGQLSSHYPMVKLGELFIEIRNGKNVNQIDEVGKYKVSRIQTIANGTVDLTKTKYTDDDVSESDFLKNGDILLSHINSFDHLAKSAIFSNEEEKIIHGANLLKFRANKSIILPDYAASIFKSMHFINSAKHYAQKAVNQASIKLSDFKQIEIPLPPIEIQQKIVAAIEQYQKVIDGAKLIVDNYKPKININPEWQTAKLGDICEINPSKTEIRNLNPDLEVSFVPMACVNQGVSHFLPTETRLLNEVISGYTCFKNSDVLLAKITPCFENGKSGIAKKLINGIGFGSTEFYVLRANQNILPEIIYYCISSNDFILNGSLNMSGSAGQKRLTRNFLENYNIPIPPLDEQHKIMTELEHERQLVDNAKQLIDIMQNKMNFTISQLWSNSNTISSEANNAE